MRKLPHSPTGNGGVWRNAVHCGMQTHGGKCYRSNDLAPVWVHVLIVLGSVFRGFCEEFSVASVPLGFEISGYEKMYWVSENGVFAFGFLPGKMSDNGYGLSVGIWYNMKETGQEPVTVWTVGGGVRVSENSTFKLSMDGRLVLFDNTNSLLVWSSNTGNLGVQEASLLGNGNLILRGFEGDVVWESFDSPTDTLLPGQSLRFPQALQAPCRNPISGFYSFVIRESGNVELVWDHNISYWSSNLSPSSRARVAGFEPNGVFALFDASNQSVWSRSSKDFGALSVNLSRLRVDADGNLRIYLWDSVLHRWRVGWQAVGNQCNIFGTCGLYSICGYNATGFICDCLVKYSSGPGPAAGSELGSYGCKKMVDIGSCKMGTSMLVLKQTVLYGLYPPHDIDIMLSTEACKQFCHHDKSCFAATARNDGSGVCTIKRTSFISGYSYSSLSSVSFLKACLIPEAVSAHEAANIGNRSSTTSAEEASNHLQRGFAVSIALLFLTTASLFLLAQMLVIWFVYRRRKANSLWRAPLQKEALAYPHYRTLIRFSFEEVKDLTNNFKDLLGPSVFKGVLPNRTLVVAKVLSDVVVAETKFRMVVSTLGGTHHRNLVHLKGFCFEPKHKILLYEYVTNGSLDQLLVHSDENQNRLSLQQRLGILTGIARAIAYLHGECHQCIAHGNLKLENILLDQNLSARVTDFGLKCLSGNEAASSSETLPERDVYMFGKVLLQIITGQKDGIEKSRYSAVYQMCEDGDMGGITNSHLERGSVEWEGLERAVWIAFWCMQDQPFLRPSMDEVVKILEGSLHVDRPPMPTAFMLEESLQAGNEVEIVELTP